MFIAGLFTIAKIQKQPKCQLPDECVKKMWYTLAIAWMNLESIIISEINQTKTNTVCFHLYGESKKYDTNELIHKTETDSQTQKTNS